MNKPHAESLETRRLLSATLDSSGTLIITGTRSADTISLSLSGSNLQVNDNGTIRSFLNSAVNRVVASLLAGNDSFSASSGVTKPMEISGGDGNDTLTGGGGPDTLVGDRGNDVFNGGGGTDLVDYSANKRTNPISVSIDGVANDDDGLGGVDDIRTDVEAVTGGQGNDTIVGSAGNNRLRGMAGNDSLSGGDGDDSFEGGKGNDTIEGGSGVDTMDYSRSVTNLAVTLDGLANDGAFGEVDAIGADVENCMGGSGNDLITGSPGANLLMGGGGNDTLIGLGGIDTLLGEAGNDLLQPGPEAGEAIDGGDGTDTVSYAERTASVTVNLVISTTARTGTAGEAGEADALVNIEGAIGGSANDVMTVTSNGVNGSNVPPFRLEGRGGNDTLVTQPSTSVYPLVSLVGGDGGDTLLANDNLARCFGDAGDDVARFVLNANDSRRGFFEGGAGTDLEDYSGTTPGLTPLALRTGNQVENLIGTAGADIITGNALDNDLQGGDGDDTIDGQLGSDIIDGGDGNDSASYATRGQRVQVTLTVNASGVMSGTGGQVTLPMGVTDTDSFAFLERVIGGSGPDLLTITTAALTSGTPIVYVLEGGGGADTLTHNGPAAGTSQTVSLLGGAGNDEFNVRGLGTVANGGADDDEWNLLVDGPAGSFDGGDGTDTQDLTAATGLAAFTLDANVENGVAVAGMTLTGNALNNTLSGVGGVTLLGEGGNDTLLGSGGSDSLEGGAGLDTVTYATRTSSILGTISADATGALTGTVTIGGETDNLASVETLIGGSAADTLTASTVALNSGVAAPSIRIEAGDGSDVLNIEGALIGSSATLVSLFGGNGNDLFSIRGIGSSAFGEAGNDVWQFDADDVNGTFDGGLGNDSQNFAAASGGTGPTTFSLGANVEVGIAGSGQTMIGNDLDNGLSVSGLGPATLLGGAGNDSITGSPGNDSIDGGAGNDNIRGEDGNDTLIGGTGRDSVVGGAGIDSIFTRDDGVIDTLNADGTDIILRDNADIVRF